MSRYCTQISWDDAPHLTSDQKALLLGSIPPHQRDARTKGIPILGAGQIYPLPEGAVVIDDFEMPIWWPRAFGLDVGWNTTAAVWGAWDRESDTVYIYSEYYAGQQVPVVHASGIRSRGDWIPGAIDPASAGSSQADGKKLLDEYRNIGLDLFPADNAIEAGIFACYQRLAAGRLKVFKSCRNWLAEFRIYRRDENGKIVKERDHLMDAMRYLTMSGMRVARTEPTYVNDMEARIAERGRSAVTGY